MIADTFQLQFMTLTIDSDDGCGSSNKIHRQVQPKKTKVCNTVLAIHITARVALTAVYS